MRHTTPEESFLGILPQLTEGQCEQKGETLTRKAGSNYSTCFDSEKLLEDNHKKVPSKRRKTSHPSDGEESGEDCQATPKLGYIEREDAISVNPLGQPKVKTESDILHRMLSSVMFSRPVTCDSLDLYDCTLGSKLDNFAAEHAIESKQAAAAAKGTKEQESWDCNSVLIRNHSYFVSGSTNNIASKNPDLNSNFNHCLCSCSIMTSGIRTISIKIGGFGGFAGVVHAGLPCDNLNWVRQRGVAWFMEIGYGGLYGNGQVHG